VIDTPTQQIHTLDNFKTSEVEREGKKRVLGPTAASVGEGFVYVGNRGDSSVCAVDAAALTLAGCVKLSAIPDAVVYLAGSHEVWVTAPRAKTIFVLDVSAPAAPKLTGSFTLDGEPEGYAVDNGRNVFFTNLEDKDQTLKIDVKTHKVLAQWAPACGADGPKGLAYESKEQLLVVACPDHIETLDAQTGKTLSKLDTGDGVDNLDYVPEGRLVYAAAGRAGKLTVANLDAKGLLAATRSQATSKGARNAVADEAGVAYLAAGSDGKILVARPSKN
jgi:DNA-binding beta-propeller fold protein YncE